MKNEKIKIIQPCSNFPALSGLFDGGYSDFNTYAYLWSSDANMRELRGRALQYKYLSTGTQTSETNLPMQYGCGVRCVKNE